MNSNSNSFFFSESKDLMVNNDVKKRIDEFLWKIGSGEFSINKFMQKFNISLSIAESILDHYIETRILDKKICRKCPNEDCIPGIIWEDDFEEDYCPTCNCELSMQWRQNSTEPHYFINRSGRQFSPWLLLLHGMNTPGEWQEDTVFRLGLRNEKSPFEIYKYGIIRVSPFFKILQSCRVKNFIKKYNLAAQEAKDNGIDDPPDVIAHSFGTLIIGRALEKYPKLCMGKVLLCGSILRPDFNWSKYIEEGRVSKVLNHFGGKDFWAKIAIYAIPGSGPSGRVGFVESESSHNYLFNFKDPDYKHSDFFSKDKFDHQFKYLWQPFLWGKLEELKSTINLHQGIMEWHPPSLIIRIIMNKWIIVAFIIILFILCKFILGSSFHYL
jgi:hypothetical protein